MLRDCPVSAQNYRGGCRCFGCGTEPLLIVNRASCISLLLRSYIPSVAIAISVSRSSLLLVVKCFGVRLIEDPGKIREEAYLHRDEFGVMKPNTPRRPFHRISIGLVVRV